MLKARERRRAPGPGIMGRARERRCESLRLPIRALLLRLRHQPPVTLRAVTDFQLPPPSHSTLKRERERASERAREREREKFIDNQEVTEDR